MAAVAPSPLDTANANSHILVNYLNMSDADWAARQLSVATKGRKSGGSVSRLPSLQQS